MLHSTLPRAFLTPGLSYLSYYGEDVRHPYAASSTTWHIPMDDPSPIYAKMQEHVGQQPFEPMRTSTPSPLDLSLKPAATSRVEEAIEVDDEEDRRMREAIHRRLEAQRYKKNVEEERSIVEDIDMSPRSSSVLSQRSYEHIPTKKEPPQYREQMDEILRKSLSQQELTEKSCVSKETITRLPSYSIGSESAQKYHHVHSQKLLMSSPTQLAGYHSQLLLTPQHHLQGIHAPMTPPSTPSPPQCPRRRPREEDVVSPTGPSTVSSNTANPSKPSTSGEKQVQRPKKKHARRLKFDEDTSSPVSGTVILGPDEAVVTGDIDPAFNIVEVTEEARAELAKIENRLGPYQCKLCQQLHDDAFQLAQHRCSRIAHVEYRCPECDKRFSCPANLASHRRWHKPRIPSSSTTASSINPEISCSRCEAKFTRQAALRKHMTTQHPETNNNHSRNNSVNVLLEESDQLGKIDAVRMNAIESIAAETT